MRALGLCETCRGRKWRREHPDEAKQQTRKSALKLLYRLTPEEFQAILVQQLGCCAICRTDEPGGKRKRFLVDHDHATGEVRGLLCLHCNVMVGMAKDDPLTLNAAAMYLEGYIWAGPKTLRVS